MQGKTTIINPGAEETGSFPCEQLSGAARQRTNRTSDPGDAAADWIDESREVAANVIDRAASAIQDAENLPGGEKVSRFTDAAADNFHSSAQYIRTRNVTGMIDDLKALVKNNPGPSLLVAAALGFLVVRPFRNNR